MEWPKLKNIILIILLVTNLFLLSLVGLRSWNASRYHAEARADALLVLEKNGIHMEQAALPEDIRLPAATVTRDREAEEELMMLLLGERLVSAPGGGDFTYTGEKGNAILSNRGEFQISLSPDAYPVSGELADHALELLDLMEMKATVVSSEGDATGGTVSLLQLWNDTPVRSCQITVSYAGEKSPVVISGTRISAAPVSVGEVELSAVTGVLRFLEKFTDSGDVCNEILVMQAEYQLTASLSDPATLTPVWRFVTDSGSYTLDMITGQLKKQ